jgi:hypothetical protein
MRIFDDTKDVTFEYLPNSNDFWVVLFWGRVVLDFKGDYKVEVVFNPDFAVELSSQT